VCLGVRSLDRGVDADSVGMVAPGSLSRDGVAQSRGQEGQSKENGGVHHAGDDGGDDGG